MYVKGMMILRLMRKRATRKHSDLIQIRGWRRKRSIVEGEQGRRVALLRDKGAVPV